MEKELIYDYQEGSLSIEGICKKYKIGKIKAKKILSDNNIPLNGRGAKIKNINVPFKYEILINKDVQCKNCKKIYSDVENKSGALISHMLECTPHVEIPSKLKRANYKNQKGVYWHFQYFNLIDKQDKPETLKCPMCDWETTDLVNKSGSLTKHINTHDITIEEFLLVHPDFSKYFNVHNLGVKRKEEISNDFVTCKICGEKMKIISNTHLMTSHNITQQQYKLKYPFDKLVNESLSSLFRDKLIDNNKNMKPTWTSKGETEIVDFLKGLGFNVEKGTNRKLLEGKEIDILIDEKKIAIEYDGLYYHTEKMGKNSTYHIDKTIECKKMGYDLIHIFEDEWVTNKDLVKNKLKHILGVNDSKIVGARKLFIKKITSKEKSEFLKENHIQGNDNSSIWYGGFYENELLGVMTFNDSRNMTKSKNGELELSRFCIKQNLLITGLSSRFLKEVIKEYQPSSIISFADRRWTLDSENNLYTKLGFYLSSVVKPTYYYYNSKVDKYKRLHKFGFGKNNLKRKYPYLDFNKTEKILANELGYERIWDCGLFKYKLDLK